MPEIIQLNKQDPFAEARAELNLPAGNVPAFEATTPGMSVMTLEVPSGQKKENWRSFLHMLSIADGMVVLRPSDTAEFEDDGYLYNSTLLGEIYEIVDARPMFIVTVVKGPLRASMMMLAGISSITLATKDSTFGFPDFAQTKVHPVVKEVLSRRMTKAFLKRLTLVGDSITAREAQRMGLVDFVGDEETVENEISRLIYRHCSPQTGIYMHKQDMINAMKAQEGEQMYAATK